MKISLLKKLFVCLFGRQAIIVAAVLFISAAKAQIIYTNVKPDVKFTCSKVGCSHEYDLDLNNDGVIDFRLILFKGSPFYCENYSFLRIYITALDSNSVVTGTDTSNAGKLSSNAVISDISNYSFSEETIEERYGIIGKNGNCVGVSDGEWLSTTDGYIGLKLKKARLIYYGWARLSVSVSSTSASFTIKDYAYNSIPSRPILSGEKSCTSPSITLSANGPLSFCAGDSVILTANGTGYLYQWKKNGANITGATSQTYVAKAAGVYKCKVTNSCGSKTSKGDTVAVPCKGLLNNAVTSEEKIISKIIQLNVTPNPISNSTTISFSLPQAQKVSISIFDMNGRLIKTLADAQVQSGTHQLTWNAKGEKGNPVAAGIYLLKMQAGNYVETKKISVVK